MVRREREAISKHTVRPETRIGKGGGGRAVWPERIGNIWRTKKVCYCNFLMQSQSWGACYTRTRNSSWNISQGGVSKNSKKLSTHASVGQRKKKSLGSYEAFLSSHIPSFILWSWPTLQLLTFLLIIIYAKVPLNPFLLYSILKVHSWLSMLGNNMMAPVK